MFCPKCGKELRDNAAFCNGCGAPLQNESNNFIETMSSEVTNIIVTKPVKIIMIILSCVSLLFNVMQRISWGTINVIEWAIIPGILLIVGCAFLNRMKPTLMVIPMVCPIVLDLMDAIRFQSIGIILSIILLFEILFVIFGTLSIVKRKLSVKIFSLISLGLYFVLLIRNYRVFGIISTILTTTVWYIFIIAIPTKTKTNTKNTDDHINTKTTNFTSFMFCPNCGNRFPMGKKFCDQCGSELKETVGQFNSAYQNANDAPSTGFSVLGFFFPVVGLILYLVWKDNLPLRAKSAGKGALIGAITSVSLTIITYIVYFLILSSLF